MSSPWSFITCKKVLRHVLRFDLYIDSQLLFASMPERRAFASEPAALWIAFEFVTDEPQNPRTRNEQGTHGISARLVLGQIHFIYV